MSAIFRSLIILVLSFFLVHLCDSYHGYVRDICAPSMDTVFNEVFKQGAKTVVKEIPAGVPSDEVLLFPLDGEIDPVEMPLTMRIYDEIETQTTLHPTYEKCTSIGSTPLETIYDFLLYAFGHFPKSTQWMSIQPLELAKKTQQKNYTMFLRGKILETDEDTPSVKFIVELWDVSQTSPQMLMKKTVCIPTATVEDPAESSDASYAPDSGDSAESTLPTAEKHQYSESKALFYLFSFVGILVWLLILTPIMNSVLKDESTKANILFLLLSSLAAVLFLYSATSLQTGWEVDLLRLIILLTEGLLILFLTMSWMSFLESRQH